MVEQQVQQEATNIHSWLQDAVGDMAFDMVKLGDYWDEKLEKKVKKAKKEGVTDVTGWLADELYNQVDTMRDLAGDRVHDAASKIRNGQDFDKVFCQIADALGRMGHGALKRACKQMTKDRR